jgi:hypothetical protein
MDSDTDIVTRHGHRYSDTINVQNTRYKHRYIFIKYLNWESKYIHVHLSWASFSLKKVLREYMIVHLIFIYPSIEKPLQEKSPLPTAVFSYWHYYLSVKDCFHSETYNQVIFNILFFLCVKNKITINPIKIPNSQPSPSFSHSDCD